MKQNKYLSILFLVLTLAGCTRDQQNSSSLDTITTTHSNPSRSQQEFPFIDFKKQNEVTIASTMPIPNEAEEKSLPLALQRLHIKTGENNKFTYFKSHIMEFEETNNKNQEKTWEILSPLYEQLGTGNLSLNLEQKIFLDEWNRKISGDLEKNISDLAGYDFCQAPYNMKSHMANLAQFSDNFRTYLFATLEAKDIKKTLIKRTRNISAATASLMECYPNLIVVMVGVSLQNDVAKITDTLLKTRKIDKGTARNVAKSLLKKDQLLVYLKNSIINEFWLGTYSYAKLNKEYFSKIQKEYKNRFPDDSYLLFDENEFLSKSAACYQALISFLTDKKENNFAVCQFKSTIQFEKDDLVEKITWKELHEENIKMPGVLTQNLLALFLSNMPKAEKVTLEEIENLNRLSVQLRK